MAIFDNIFLSALFGLAGTFILLFSNIIAYKCKVIETPKYYLLSQLIGFLFLFNGFLYQLYPKIIELELIGSSFPIAEFSYWPYYLFIGAGIIISLVLVNEKDIGERSEVFFDANSWLRLGVFYSPIVFAFLALILNLDYFLILNIFAWLWFMGMFGGRN
jgi:hypothetical protein